MITMPLAILPCLVVITIYAGITAFAFSCKADNLFCGLHYCKHPILDAQLMLSTIPP